MDSFLSTFHTKVISRASEDEGILKPVIANLLDLNNMRMDYIREEHKYITYFKLVVALLRNWTTLTLCSVIHSETRWDPEKMPENCVDDGSDPV